MLQFQKIECLLNKTKCFKHPFFQFYQSKLNATQKVIMITKHSSTLHCSTGTNQSKLGPRFLCWILGVVPYNTWLISSWEENKCSYKLRKCTKWHLFHSKWLKLSFRVKIVVILSVAQLVATVIFFSAWDKSRVKLDNCQNSKQKMWT